MNGEKDLNKKIDISFKGKNYGLFDVDGILVLKEMKDRYNKSTISCTIINVDYKKEIQN